MHVQSDDEVIVTRCLEGDKAAFAFLVNKYKGAVHAYAYLRVPDYQDAQDIVQEVFIKAYKKLAQLKWPHRFQSWLYTIAANECKLWLRKDSKGRKQEVPLEDVPEENLDELAVRDHSDEDIELTVRSAMETLPDNSRLALSLYYMSDLSTKEVAGFMGISPNNVGVILHRARKQLGERLEKMIGKQLKKEKLKSGFIFKVADSIRDMPIPSLSKPPFTKWAPIPISIGLALLIGIIGYGVSSGKDISPDMPILKSATFEVSLLSDLDRQIILDAEPENISNLVAAGVGDPEQTQPATGTESSGVVIRRVWEDNYYAWSVSPDGQYLSYVNRDTGNLAIRSFRTGEKRDVTDEGEGWGKNRRANLSTWSPDSKQIAYTWLDPKAEVSSLRIVGIKGSKPRVLRSMKSGALPPKAWSRDGKHILALHWKGKSKNVVLVSVADGSIRVLKSVDSTCGQDIMSFSPDGRYVVYDSHPPQGKDSPNHDIFLVAMDGSHEMTLVEHPAKDFAPFWTPDGNGIVFASNRSGSMGLWILEVVDGKPKGQPQLIKQNLDGMWPLGLTQDGSFYYRSVEHGHSDVYVATLDPEAGEVAIPQAKVVQNFEGFTNYGPAFSPDGKYLAYTSKRPREENSEFRAIVIRSLETGEERELSPERAQLGLFHYWFPDGRSILIGGEQGLHRIDTEDDAATKIPVALDDEQGFRLAGVRPEGSPDGSKMFFMRERNGTRAIRIYDFETERELRPDFQLACGEGYAPGLALSPDGQQLAFMVICGDEASLQIAPSSGGYACEVLKLSIAEESGAGALTWTPDGRYLFFLGNPKNEATETGDPWWASKLWRVPVEGGEPQNLGLTMKYDTYLSFHPDGRRIAFNGPVIRARGVWAIENFLPGFTADK